MTKNVSYTCDGPGCTQSVSRLPDSLIKKDASGEIVAVYRGWFEVEDLHFHDARCLAAWAATEAAR